MTTTETTVEHRKTHARAWNLGDALWWRDEDGVHVVLLTEESEGDRRGTMTTINAPTLAAINDALGDLGFDPSDLTEDEIKWCPKPKPVPDVQWARWPKGKRHTKQNRRVLLFGRRTLTVEEARRLALNIFDLIGQPLP
jgi:hypothetical protein